MALLLEKTKRQYTYEDSAKLPEGAPINSRRIGYVTIANAYHQIISRRIEFELVKFVEDKKLGEVLEKVF